MIIGFPEKAAPRKEIMMRGAIILEAMLTAGTNLDRMVRKE